MNVDQNAPVAVEGNTDNVPISGGAFPSNWELSTARASSVVRFLIGQGVDRAAPERVGLRRSAPDRQQCHGRRHGRSTGAWKSSCSASYCAQPVPKRNHECGAQRTFGTAEDAQSKKMLIPARAVLLGASRGYTMTKPKAVKQKIPGTIYVLPQPFLLNLNEGHYAKLTSRWSSRPGRATGRPPRRQLPAPKAAPERCPRNPPCAKSSPTGHRPERHDALQRQGRNSIKHHILDASRSRPT